MELHLRKHIVRALVLMMVAVLIVVVLAWLGHKPADEKNGFTRRFTTPVAKLVAASARPKGIREISGAMNGQLYFQTKNPAELVVLQRNLTNPHTITLPVPEDRKISSRFDCLIDSPSVYIFAGNGPYVFIGTPDGKKMEQYRFPASLYSRAVVLSPHSIAMRAFDTIRYTSNQLFIKGDPVTGKFEYEQNISEKTNDDGMSSDGSLEYDKQTGLLIYTYFYCNRFLCLDSNLRLVYKGRTIDTISSYQANMTSIQKGNVVSKTNGAPTRIVNWIPALYNGRLFNNSWLKADNETPKDFENNSVIDVYRLKDGAYEGSFYIPAYKEEKMEQYKILGNELVTLYKNYIITYRIPDAFQ